MSWSSFPPLVTAGVYLLTGVYVLRHFQGRRSEVLPYCLWLFTTVYWQLGWAIVFSVRDPGLIPLLVRLNYTGIVFIPIAFYHFFSAVLDSAADRRWVGAAYAAGVVFAALCWWGDAMVDGAYRFSWGYYAKAGTFHPFYLVFLITLVLRVLLILRHADGRYAAQPLRQAQIRLLRWAYVAYLPAAVDFAVNYGVDFYPIGFLFTVMSLGIVSYAVVRHQFLEIRPIVRQTAVYSIVTLLLASVYGTVLTLVMRGIEWRRGGLELGEWLLLGTVIAALLHPLEQRVRLFVDELFNRVTEERQTHLMRFSDRLRQRSTLEDLAQLAAGALDRLFLPQRGVIYLRSGASLVHEGFGAEILREMPPTLPPLKGLRMETPAETGPVFERLGEDSSWQEWLSKERFVLALPLLSREETFGLVLLGTKRSGLPFLAEDVQLLRLVGNEIVLALESQERTRELGGGLAHELKMPLSKVALPAELTLLDMDDLASGRKEAKAVVEAVRKRMRTIIEQAIIAAGRVDAVQEVLLAGGSLSQSVDLSAVLRKSLIAVEPLRERLAVETNVDLPESGPLVRGNARQLEIVFTNLIKNALEAKRTAAATLAVAIQRSYGGDVNVQIRDNGAGLTPEQIANLGKPFVSSKGKDGMGLGLFLVRQILASHNAALNVDSNRGETKFSVTFPGVVK